MNDKKPETHLADGGFIWVPATYGDNSNFYQQQRTARVLVITIWIALSLATFCYTWSTMETYLHFPAIPIVSYLGDQEDRLMNIVLVKFSDFADLMLK